MNIRTNPVATGLSARPLQSSLDGVTNSASEIEARYEGCELVPGEVLVQLRGDLGAGLMGNFASTYGAELLEKINQPESVFKSTGGDLVRLRLPAGSNFFEALATMSLDQRVKFAEPNQVFTLERVQMGPARGDDAQQQPPSSDPAEPNDLDPKLWGLHNSGQTGGTAGADVSAKAAWRIQTGDGSAEGPLIAVIDTGVDYNHPDLKANLWTNPGEIPGDGIDNDGNGVIDDIHGYHPAQDSGDPMDGHSHGTHVSGTIAGVGNNGIGVTGVMQNARVMAVKIFSDQGRTTTADIVKGLNYATQMGADITSNSWGGGRPSEAIKGAFEASPALHVIAAGNSNYDNDERGYFPASYDLDNIVAVAASDHNDSKARFSQWGGTLVDVSAPGKDIYSTVPGDKYASYSGTSMATPHVSGGAGLIMSEFPGISNAEVKDRLIYGSDRKEALLDISVSDGRVNFASSLEHDSVAPGAPNDFGASKVHTRGGTLSWTSVGDDKWGNGAAQTVEIRVSDQPINADNIDQASAFTMAGAAEVGDLASVTFGGPPSETPATVHFAMRSIDNVGNRSDLRTATANIPASSTAFSDDFDGETTQFGTRGDFRTVEVEGRGKVFSSASGEGGSKGLSWISSSNIDLSGRSNSYLKFDTKLSLVRTDIPKVRISEDGGESWKTLVQLPDRKTDWTEHGYDISAYDGKNIQLRFSVDCRRGSASEGMMIDKVRVLSDPRAD